MNCLRYLVKDKFNTELDYLILKWFKIAKEYDGKKCKQCGFVQGIEYKGVKKSYCEHRTLLIDRRLKKEKKEITKKIFLFMVSNDDRLLRSFLNDQIAS